VFDLERDPADSLWLRVKRGDWCFDIIARPRFSAADAPFEPAALDYDSNQPGLKNK
jgi:hypothetical protein